jgi:hypothetical protein
MSIQPDKLLTVNQILALYDKKTKTLNIRDWAQLGFLPDFLDEVECLFLLVCNQINKLPTSYRQLKELSIIMCKQWLPVPHEYTQLRELHLCDCNGNRILRGFPNLQKLRLTDNDTEIVDCPNLTQIIITDCIKLTNIKLRISPIYTYVRHCPKLIELDFTKLQQHYIKDCKWIYPTQRTLHAITYIQRTFRCIKASKLIRLALTTDQLPVITANPLFEPLVFNIIFRYLSPHKYN